MSRAAVLIVQGGSGRFFLGREGRGFVSLLGLCRRLSMSKICS